MVDADVLRRGTERVLHHCDRLERRPELNTALLDEDEDVRNAVLMDLQQAIQGCIDLTAHRCVDDALGAPASAADAFALIARHGIIDEVLARRLVGAAGLRNLIVHQYGDIDLERIVRVHPYRSRRSASLRRGSERIGPERSALSRGTRAIERETVRRRTRWRGEPTC